MRLAKMFLKYELFQTILLQILQEIHKLLRRRLPLLCKLKWSFEKPPLIMSCAGKSWNSFVLIVIHLQPHSHLRVFWCLHSCTDVHIVAETGRKLVKLSRTLEVPRRLESDQLHPRIFVYLLGPIAYASLRWILSGQKYNHKVSKIVKETSYWCLWIT